MGNCMALKKKDQQLSIFIQNSSQLAPHITQVTPGRPDLKIDCTRKFTEAGTTLGKSTCPSDNKLLQVPKFGSQKTQILTSNATREVRRLYNVKQHFLGSGAYGQVFLAELKNDPSKKYAIKIMQLSKMKENIRNQMREELNVLHKNDHPHVVKYVQSFEDDKKLYIIMEYIKGQDLFKQQEESGVYEEKHAAKLMYTILEAINHIHSNGIVHRDLKPDNIMLDEKNEPKIIDFGLSKDLGQNIRELKSMVGSKIFMAPEIIERTSHSYPCDLWSLGIILFVMLSGNYPFSTKNLEHEIVNEPIIFMPNDGWNDISQLAKNFLHGLLTKDPSERLTAKQALDHVWFKQIFEDNSIDELASPLKKIHKQVSEHVVNKLSNYRAQSKIKVAALNVFLNMLDQKDIEPLIAKFKKMDTEKTGFITAKQLRETLQEKNINIKDSEVELIIREMDLNGNQKINYSEFLTATVEVKKIMTDEKLWMMFKQFDIDDKDFITPENISMTMSKMGKKMTKEDLSKSMRLHQFQNDNAICFEEFKVMFAEDQQPIKASSAVPAGIAEEDFMINSQDGSPVKQPVNILDI